jgi:peptidoglycan-associated lipoprotein
MKMRQIPALCAGITMLAACSNLEAPPPTSSGVAQTGMVTPGSLEEEVCGFSNVGNTLYFATDSAILTAEAQEYAQRQACWIQLYPQHTLTIEGHADERGTREYNLALGERRAQAVLSYFVALGVDPKRLKTISYGKERPFCTEAEEACWSQNRRAVSTLDP